MGSTYSSLPNPEAKGQKPMLPLFPSIARDQTPAEAIVRALVHWSFDWIFC
jgi:hypothetical protein